jgi:regulator of ribonuclease activity A
VFTTPDLCDDHPDEVRVLAPVFRTFGGREAFFGRAVTVRCADDNSRVKDLVATPGEGRVIVVDNGGSTARALLGDQTAQAAADNGWAGIVIDGLVRDVEILRTIDLGSRRVARTRCGPSDAAPARWTCRRPWVASSSVRVTGSTPPMPTVSW